MNIHIDIANSAEELGKRAAWEIALTILSAIEDRGKARIILSTGQSQFETLKELVEFPVDWSKVEMFHLDEYVGISPEHPASFRKYLTDRFVSKVSLKEVHFVGSESIEALSAELESRPVDIGVIGIGENGHIAFNDPPADFDTESAYKIVTLDRKCREQQVHEGWFASVDEVPEKAITMCVRRIMASKHIVSAVPFRVKAEAVRNTITEKVSPYIPATILKTHPDWSLFLDRDSASLLLGME